MEGPDHLDKAWVLVNIEGAILISYVIILVYLKCKLKMETDFRAKLVIGMYLSGMFFGFVSWIADLNVEEGDPKSDGYRPVFVFIEMVDSFADYLITFGIYMFIYDML